MLYLLSTYSARYCTELRHKLLFRLITTTKKTNSVSLKDSSTLGEGQDTGLQSRFREPGFYLAVYLGYAELSQEQQHTAIILQVGKLSFSSQRQ